MVKYTKNLTNKASKKILPGLGGQTNNYIKKGSCLRKILLFLANKITKIENSSEMKYYKKNQTRFAEKSKFFFMYFDMNIIINATSIFIINIFDNF